MAPVSSLGLGNSIKVHMNKTTNKPKNPTTTSNDFLLPRDHERERKSGHRKTANGKVTKKNTLRKY